MRKSDADADPFAPANVQLLAIPQLVNPGEVRDEPLLPSFLYLPGAADFPAGSTALPWDANPTAVVGRLAQKRGTENVGRMVSSAKSWLSHSGVDRTSPLLPFRAPEGVEKISPVEASRRYLEHLRDAWNEKMPDAPFADQQVLVTVPASFDAVARELTLEASKQAGYRDITLLEEPQAAFYAWIERHADWRERVQVGDLILVVDIGGGTTDFTLIAVTESNGELSLNRVAVGEHILLGGDNIDLALAGVVAQRLAEKGTRIDSRQLQALWSNCRVAKEKLLEPGSKAKEQPVTILGKGTGLVGGTIKATLLREDIERVLTDGFLPAVASTDMPARQRRGGVQELGLPYAADAAITRHLARFLRQDGEMRRGPSGLACPTHVLFNGGVLNAQLVRERILGALDAWLGEEGMPPIKPLSGEDLMHAVSRGAAYYGSGAPRPRRAHSRRRSAHVLHRCGIGHAVRPWISRAHESLDGSAVRDGGRRRYPYPRPRIRTGGRPACRVSVLHFSDAQERWARRPDRRFRRCPGRVASYGSHHGRGGRYAGSSAGIVRERGDRDWHAATLVRSPRRPKMETGI